MRITTSNPIPSLHELIEVMKRDFSSAHTYTIFGLGKQKSVIVGKTLISGAQISLNNNETTIQSTAPSLGTSYALTFLSLTWVGTLLGAVFTIFSSPKTSSVNFEKEIASFLKKKYG